MSELVPTSSPSLKPGVKLIPLLFLKVSPNNIRFQDSEPSPEFIESIKTTGILMPLIVAPQGKDKTFDILVGSQRYKALVKLNPKSQDTVSVPCLVSTAESVVDQLAISSIENTFRTNLKPAEYKAAIEIAKRNKVSQRDLAKAMGVSASAISQMANSDSWSDYKKRHEEKKKKLSSPETTIREVVCPKCKSKLRNEYNEGTGKREWEVVEEEMEK